MLSRDIVKDIKRMALYVFVLTLLMVGFFAVFGYFDLSVVLGALLGYAAAILNFYLLAVTVTKSVNKTKNGASGFMGISYVIRMCIIAAIVIAAIKMPAFNYLAAVIPLVFPRIAIMIMNILNKRKGGGEN